jgi:hypothetical protein
LLLLVEICAVVASLAMVAIAVAAIRAMYCVEKATHQVVKVAGEIQDLIGEASELTREARETLVSVRGAIAPISRIVDGFGILGERAVGLSSAVLGEIEAPIHTAVAVARGIKSVTAYFMERLTKRFTPGRSATNGESDNE